MGGRGGGGWEERAGEAGGWEEGEAHHHPGTVSVGIRSGLSSYHSLDKLKQQGFRSQQAKVFSSVSSSLSPRGLLEPHAFPVIPVGCRHAQGTAGLFQRGQGIPGVHLQRPTGSAVRGVKPSRLAPLCVGSWDLSGTESAHFTSVESAQTITFHAHSSTEAQALHHRRDGLKEYGPTGS